MRTTKRPGVVNAQDAETRLTQRLNVRVTPSAYERLLIHAIKAKRNPGELIDSLITQHLRAWKVQENSVTRGKTNDRHDEPPCVSDSAPSEPERMVA